MKFLLKTVRLVGVILIAVPIVAYRAVKPCTMLKKELVERVERRTKEARAEVREAAGDLGENAGRMADDIAETVEGMAVGFATGLAEAKVERMSTRECVSELIDLKLGGDPDSL
jgi:uncharacterized protein YjbJ (UPF0337 family)